MKKLLFLGGSAFQVPVIEKAKELGLYVGCVDINPNAPGASCADKIYVCSILDKEKLFEIAQDFKPDAICKGVGDMGMTSVAYLCEKLGLPGISVETAIKATNKLEMLYALKEHDVAHPKFQLIRKEDIQNAILNIPYPVISKPVDGASSKGVSLIRNESELIENIEYSSKAGILGDVLVEEYMEGPEVSVEVLVVDSVPYVLQITDKITSGPPYFYEIGHVQPSAHPENVRYDISRLASDAALAIGIENSPAHIEIKVTESGSKIVEIAARLGGDYITSHLIDTSVSGINMRESSIMLSLGEMPDVSHYRNSGVSVAVRFIPTKKGKLIAINGYDTVQADSNVIKVGIEGKIGQCYKDAHSNYDRFGYVIAKGNSNEEALDNCTKNIDKIQFIME